MASEEVQTAEAAVHADRKFLMSLPDGQAVVKLDFSNAAFNSVRRDKILEAVHDLAPEIYPLVHSAYSPFSGEIILSCQQKEYSREIL